MKELPTSVLESRLRMLSDEKCQMIYDAALTIIADIGMTVPHAEARDILVNGAGATVEDLHEATNIDPWFLDQIVLLNEIGDALREVKGRDGAYLMQNNIDSSANFLVGGQIRGEPPRLFDVYSEGNFIEATPDT